jgi:hypothetical protein
MILRKKILRSRTLLRKLRLRALSALAAVRPFVEQKISGLPSRPLTPKRLPFRRPKHRRHLLKE